MNRYSWGIQFAMMIHKPYPSDVSEDEWVFAALYLALLPETGAQRERALREVFNRRRYMVRTASPGARCRMICRSGGGLSATVR
ncbi:hypothetical protein Nham_4103 (plasmid) [Nitrobacter hamburgensis X14]|uniref:Transposase n=1 Tax=Nitrobacter hamburgensis (strain DSM 10229 / NCIMB 13809 / X14) TaxID=323097 RepID=Q1QG98_NITHX|nr:hypothetical protein [Nitrobacter hamburgensis]ABE64749.1 hypothetical protein Nham_4103 [Nitrobacter hamburgensis X14]